MKSFLCKGKRPIIKWGLLPDNVFYEGVIPEGYSLAISPWGYDGYVVIDVDRHGEIDGFDNIPKELFPELKTTLNYHTKNKGKHYWFKYTGTQKLANKASGKGIDLRTNKGYVIWYPKGDIRNRLEEIKNSSKELNIWLESLFGYKQLK